MTTDAPARLALEGGDPVRATPFAPPPPAPHVGDDQPERVVEGEASPIRAFEAAFAAALDLPPAYATASGSYRGAMEIAFTAAGIGRNTAAPGSEVIVPALVADAFLYTIRDLGYVPVPVDVEADSVTLSPRALAQALSPRTVAVCVTHAFGHPATMTDVRPLARDAGVPIIEDASAALGASYRGEPAGRLGDVAVFEFRPEHIITAGSTPTGERRGAIVLVQDDEAAERARFGRFVTGATIDFHNALISHTELDARAEALETRRALAWELTFNIHGMRGVAPMPHGRWIRHGYDRYVARLRMVVWKRSLADTVAALLAEGIPCEPACRPSLHRDAAIRAALASGDDADPRLDDARFAVSARLPDELIAFPLHGGLTSRDMADIGAALRKVERWST
jgi:dTDP-4-amino-4,6-dideoxygalactose transaminase